MPPLKPFEDAVLGLLEETGITPKVDKTTQTDTFRNALLKRRGDLDSVAATLIELMDGAENENVRLSAAKMIASAHGALNEVTDAPPPSIHINITGDGSQTVLNLVMPKGISNVESVGTE